ncbi:alpha/beta-hydrolase [Xylariaceae sp. AK1471]|nr:alpha/beta-hydrolase [Xylariaceae sp. AK1471]
MQSLARIPILTLLFLLGTSSSAQLNAACHTETVPTALVAEFDLFSQYASAIYCDNNAQSPKGTPISCSKGTCPQVEGANATVFGNFFNIGYFESTGVLAVDPLNHRLVLAFRGAEGNGFEATYLNELISCAAICSECHCGSGFYDSWTDVRDQVVTMIAAAQQEYPDYSLALTGHSLGGSQAVLAAAELRTNGTAAALFTYGQPRVGDTALAEYVTRQGQNYRITHTVDPAPRLPPNGTVLGFVHNSPEYWIFEDTNTNYTVNPEQIKVIYGINSTEGSLGQNVYDASAHVEYFQPQMALCYTSIAPLATATPTASLN